MTDKGNMPQQHGQVQDFMDPMRNPGLLSTHYQLYSLTNLHPIPNHAAPETHVAATRAPSLSLPFLNNPIKEHYEFLGPPSDEPKFDGDLDFKKTLQALVSRNPALAPLIDPPRMKISQFEDFMREYLQIYFRERYDGHNGTSSCPVPFTHPGHLWNETLEKQGPVFLNIISEYKQEAIKQWERDMKRTLEKLLKDRSISQPALQGSEPLQDREDRVLNAIQIVDSSMETGAARGITTDTPGVPLPAADTKPPSKHQNLSMLCPLFEHGGETLRPRLESCQDRLFDTLSTLKSHAISHVAPYRCAGLGCKNAYAEMKGLNRHQRTQLKNPNCRKAGMDEGMNSPAARDMVQKLHGLNLPQRPVNCPEKMEKYQRDLEDIRGDLKNIVSEYTLKDPAAKGSFAPSFPLHILNPYSIRTQPP
ncbi:hypothetical protein DFH27DRAFT_299838 [Peziza echinospora]|nr:hypothetical protein DFH27DRAFT_299838 [Peziza echinospora]